MSKYKMLVLTNHSGHSKENSMYALLRATLKHPQCGGLDIATAANTKNTSFFGTIGSQIWTSEVTEEFSFEYYQLNSNQNLKLSSLADYQVVWLRLPPPIDKNFLDFLSKEYPDVLFINDPQGIYQTGSKEFLLNFSDLCPPMQICESIEDIRRFSQQYACVLKPLREYGGKGIVRIDGDQVWAGNDQIDFQTFCESLDGHEFRYLAVKFLKNVSQGDKRIIVANGQIIGASLRLPAKDSWLCNVAQGGSSQLAQIDEQEFKIVQAINPLLRSHGIIMYGVDTLTDDQGNRVLSEINTTSIGGIMQIELMSGKPVIKETIDQIWSNISDKLS